MNILIIEDEQAAADKLQKMLYSTNKELKIIAVLQRVDEAIDFIKTNDAPHLAFVDVQLADDVSFKIFEKVSINFPVIFTTAYDDYILKALEHNSIDYLLKPITQERLDKALDKVSRLESHFIKNKLGELLNTNITSSNSGKKRFLVKKGTDIVPVAVEHVAYFFTEHKVVFLKDREGVTYIIDKSIADIATEVDGSFFRVNRKYLVHIDCIEKFKSDNGKIALTLAPTTNDSIYVSKENAPNFRQWIEEQ
ncbi:response regulator transcription factor [Fulvivirga sp. RKSG066]|uniref:LytR/AlgR family response regulator transcription factor n=1 Tax=Fulvivirga aurantia TaxID=2529383 RepID=UPI0012BD010F|nr:LytTR family DNA-binding domain-containing protein [Fulvivirga aurantia]MTI21316.1 response regulator transcription factor [Fulvivirga aurantia]